MRCAGAICIVLFCAVVKCCEECFVIRSFPANRKRHREREELRPFNTQRMVVREGGRLARLFPNAIKISVKEEANGCRAHSPTVPVGAAGKQRACDLPPLLPESDRLKQPAHALAIAALGIVNFRKFLNQCVIVDRATFAEDPRHRDRHVGVVGAIEHVDRRLVHDAGGAAELAVNIFGGKPLEWCAQAIADRMTQKTARESFEQ